MENKSEGDNFSESDENHIIASTGYTDLGMTEESTAELDAIPPQFQDRVEIISLRLQILMEEEKWKEAFEFGQRACCLFPDDAPLFIQTAICMQVLGKTKEAIEFLMAGPPGKEKEPAYYYNLACYESSLGNKDLALDHLKKSFALDPHFEEMAKEDSDLKEVWSLYLISKEGDFLN